MGNPLKSSIFGKSVGYDSLEKRMEKSKERIKTKNLKQHTLSAVADTKTSSSTESEFRAALREKGIDLVLRSNDEGRIYGATFIDHNQRVVLNGSRLGKEFSANVLNQRFADNSPREVLQQPKSSITPNQSVDPTINKHPQSQFGYSQTDDPVGSLFSVFTPEVEGTDNKQSSLKRKRKKKRRSGRQM